MGKTLVSLDGMTDAISCGGTLKPERETTKHFKGRESDTFYVNDSDVSGVTLSDGFTIGSTLTSISPGPDGSVSTNLNADRLTFTTRVVGWEVYAITHDKIAIGRTDEKIRLWDIATHKKLTTLRGHIDSAASTARYTFRSIYFVRAA